MRPDLVFRPEHFSGELPLFPIPNVVFFPQTLVPLHVFEDRYRALVRDALEGERFIGMVLPKPGWEEDYQGSPDIFSVGCLGRIIKEARTKDGRYNIILMGIHRVRIVSEIRKKPYRRAAVKIVRDVYEYNVAHAKRLIETRNQLARVYMELCDCLSGDKDKIRKILQSPLPLGLLVDLLVATLKFDIYRKQEILEEADVIRRAHLLFSTLSERPYEPTPASHELFNNLRVPFSLN